MSVVTIPKKQSPSARGRVRGGNYSRGGYAAMADDNRDRGSSHRSGRRYDNRGNDDRRSGYDQRGYNDRRRGRSRSR